MTPAPMNFNVVAPLPTYPPAVAIPTPERTLVSADPSIAGRAPVNCAEGILVNPAAEPKYVIIPAPAAGPIVAPTPVVPNLIPVLAVISPTESIFSTSSYVRVPPIVHYQQLPSYLRSNVYNIDDTRICQI